MVSIWTVCVLTVCASESLAQHEQIFSVSQSSDGTDAVSANSNGITADQALVELARSMRWGIEFETPELRHRMSLHGVDVALDHQGPRTIAHLLAIAGSADVVFNDRTVLGEHSTKLMVVSAPSADTESGRQRLRRWAVRWYRTFLQDELSHDPLVQEHGMDARMHMAKLLMEQGALEEAALVFHTVHRDEPAHDYVPQALLELARCRFELGKESWEAAEEAARELMRRHPSLPQTAAGTVLLGELLNAQERYAECVRTLTAAYLRVAGTPEIVDVYLLVAKAEYALCNHDAVLRTMRTLEGAHDYHDFGESQWLDYLFLRGYALEGLGPPEEAIEPLELFLGMGPADSRRGIAFVLLGRTYLANGRYIEARAAAVEAHHLKVGGRLDEHWSREASKFYAKTALEVGAKDEAFDKLEVEVRKSPESEPELVVYLVRAFMHEGRFQKAIITASLIADLDTDLGDTARFLRVESMWLQSKAAGGSTLRTFPERAIGFVEGIRSEDHMRRVAEIFGQAYEMTGDAERAADAYRGLLRWK